MPLTEKQKQIRELFNNFKCSEDDFFNFKFHGSGLKFRCNYCDDLGKWKPNSKKEPIWSPAFGDPGTKVMLVAEAPSTTGSKDPHLGGLFADWYEINKKWHDVIEFRKFFKDAFNSMPYYTDLIKCGPVDTKMKTLIRHRAEVCAEKFLLKEIEIIDPDFIYCIGKESFEWLKNKKLLTSRHKTIEFVWLIHYSKQAGLPLKSSDKELIWRWQLGRIPEVSLARLQFFDKKDPI